jgi:2-polyprenyl-3-methyl-5-hydroxy-6-metoxy-1,4-benzoquinol methylase
MWLSEQILYRLARVFYRSELAHSDEMKEALASPEAHRAYRQDQVKEVLVAASRYQVEIAEKTVLDLGCNDGSISWGYLDAGATRVVGVDIDGAAIEQASRSIPRRIGEDRSGRIEFRHSGVDALPLADQSVDTIVCFDVFEHVAKPEAMLRECHRVLRPGGRMLIGTWGWYHPFAPHLWSTMPVPWAHVFFSERTLLRTCRRVYQSPWYVPNIHDFDQQGRRLEDKYLSETISTDYLNKYRIRDFERAFDDSDFSRRSYPQSFGSRFASWSRIFLEVPFAREFITAYLWIVLERESPS